MRCVDAEKTRRINALRCTKIISLTSNKALALEVAKNLGIHVLDGDIARFADGETLFECNETVRGCDVYIIQSTCQPVNEKIMELLISIDALKRASAKSVNVIIPYFGYSRQERKTKPRHPISAKLVADLLTTAGAGRIICFDLHAPQIQGFFNIPVDDISAVNIFYDFFLKMSLKDIACVSPDHGGVARAHRLANKLNADLIIIDKRRTKPNKSEIIAIVGDVKDKNCIIVDDIVDTAETLCNAANKLKTLGAKQVFAAITHGILSGDAVSRINQSSLDKLIITDTIPLDSRIASDKITVLKISPLLSNVIRAVLFGESLSQAIKNFATSN
ncbi:MAG: ribose-phosphate pyrophosphokinase [Bacilli bacterium]|nr:ribose-phosphate pyrophosphokinase [Bacilli bacterium]